MASGRSSHRALGCASLLAAALVSAPSFGDDSAWSKPAPEPPMVSPLRFGTGASMTLSGQVSAALCVIYLRHLNETDLPPRDGRPFLLVIGTNVSQAVAVAGVPLMLTGGAPNVSSPRKRRSVAGWAIGTTLASLGAAAAGTGAHFIYVSTSGGDQTQLSASGSTPPYPSARYYRDLALGLTLVGGATTILGTSIAIWGMRPRKGRYHERGQLDIAPSPGGMGLRASF
jgi:hypothetical protein